GTMGSGGPQNESFFPFFVFFAARKVGFRVWRVVNEPILPLTALAIITDRGVKRCVAAEAAVHVDHILFGHAKTLGDDLHLVGPQIAFLERGNLALRLA